jgi:hypothetical protein
MSGMQTRLQTEAAAARTAAQVASAAAGAPPSPPGGAAVGQGDATAQMLAYLVAQTAYQQRFAAAQLAQSTAAAAESAAASEASLAQAAAASEAAIAQRQRTAAGPTPLFHGKANSIEAHRWLLALGEWYGSAHIGAADEKTRLEVATAALRDSAQAWWATKRADGTAAALTTWAAFGDAIRKQFMPVDIERWATRERDALVGAGARNKDVLAYTASFNALDMLLPGEREMTRVMAYERGLPQEYSVKCAERRFATLAEATSAMTALWHAKESARHAPASLNSTDIGGEQHDAAPSSSAAASSSSASSSSSTEIGDLRAQVAQLTAMMSERFQPSGRGRGGSGRGGGGGSGRSRQREGEPRTRSRTPGISDELARTRRRAGECIKCGEKGHFKDDCTNAVKTN